MLVAGDEDAKVRLFVESTKNVLRGFVGHKAPVHRTFFTADGVHVASFSDDKTVKYWDVATEKSISTFSDHNDYIRAGSVSPVSPHIIASGGYDKIVKMYDTRTNKTVMTVDHGSPIESMLFFPAGSIFVTAGGTSINIWDAFAGGKLLAQLSQHHKTVTCLALGSNGKRLLSGSLDRHVKIYDISNYQVVHNIDNSNAVLSLGVAKNDETLVTGMVDGMVAIHRKETCKDPEIEKDDNSGFKERYRSVFETVDEQVDELKRTKYRKIDYMLKNFEYIKALDAALNASYAKTPEVTVAMMKELIHRKGLHRALQNRPHKILNKVLVFLVKYIGDYRFTTTLIDSGNILLDCYEDQMEQFAGTFIGEMFVNLSKCVKKEEEILIEMLKIQGALELLFTGANIGQQIYESTELSEESKWQSSEKAQKLTVINVEDK